MRRRTTFALLGGAVASTVLTACGDSSSGGTALTVGLPNGPLAENNNPFTATSSASSLGYRWLMYEPLAQVNLIAPDSDPTPWLAESWEWNDDYTSLTATARDGVTWSDGTAFSVADIAYTFTLIKNNEALNGNAIPFGDITVTGRSVTVEFESPQYTNQDKLLHTFVVPEHLWEQIDDPTTDTVTAPVGTGPYLLKTWTAQAVTLEPNNNYWGGKPPVPQIRYTSYNDNNAQTTALANGDCQWSYVFMPDHKKVFIDKDPDNHRLWFPSGLGIHCLWINHTRKPFDNVALRQAMNLAIDRTAVHEQGEAGLYPLVASPTAIPTPVGDAFVSADYAGSSATVDIDRAKQLLGDAGFTFDGDTLTAPDGTPVTMKLVDPSGWSDYLADLQIIADNLAQIGIKAEVETMTVDAWSTALAEGDFDASIHWTNTGVTPWDIFANIMDGAQLKDLGEPAAWNFGRFDSEEATDAIAQYARTDDEETRTKALEVLQRIMVEEVPAIPLVAGPIGANYSQKHWTGWPDEDNPYAMPQPTQPSASMIVMKLRSA